METVTQKEETRGERLWTVIIHINLWRVKMWREVEERKEGDRRMEIVGGSPEDSPSLLILIKRAGFNW